ncbi:uncharacterized protein LOC113317895 [Papaver somniferum]|uniref:uncharacterized protein LOC113317895 n=1 Tax=Papaver somniferum TaxID=3469 RepID=UPI000E70037B|nr:uncharacterized protein LOC113317895 [Papaver somniferum]XP_026421800.1 uncharacterized protein LOC113317895 [Papaver somniferum]
MLSATTRIVIIPYRLDGIVIKLYFLISYKQQQVATLRRGNGKKRAEKARVGQFPLLFFVKPIFTSEEDMYETGEFQSNSFLIGKVDLSIQDPKILAKYIRSSLAASVVHILKQHLQSSLYTSTYFSNQSIKLISNGLVAKNLKYYFLSICSLKC